LVAATQLRPGVWQISLPFQGEPEIVGSYLFSGRDEIALIDPGPGSMLEAQLAAIREAGFDPADVTHLLLTHIHLDHAGMTGSLLRHMPRATVYVHSKGAPHLIDTSKVIASAERIYGDQMKELWGTIESVPEERLRIIEGDDILTIADRRLEVHYTPGHAVHHVIYFDVHSGELFCGDVAGVRLQDVDYVRPPRNVTQHLERLRERLYAWGDFVLSAMRDGKNESEIIALLIAHTEPELQRATGDPHALKRYEIATNYAMTVQGYMRYWTKKHPERL